MTVSSGTLTVTENAYAIDGTIMVNRVPDGSPLPPFAPLYDMAMSGNSVLQVNGRLQIGNINFRGDRGRVVVGSEGALEIQSGARVEFIAPEPDDQSDNGRRILGRPDTPGGELIIENGADMLWPVIPPGIYQWDGADWTQP
jgi:hypothetical protein